jgi:general secretion pathway protein G
MLQYRTSVISKKEADLRGGLFVMREALDEYAAAKGGCPSSLKALIDLGYLRAIPRDPMTGSESTWQFERTATHCDVKSGAPQMARNGTAYRNW